MSRKNGRRAGGQGWKEGNAKKDVATRGLILCISQQLAPACFKARVTDLAPACYHPNVLKQPQRTAISQYRRARQAGAGGKGRPCLPLVKQTLFLLIDHRALCVARHSRRASGIYCVLRAHCYRRTVATLRNNVTRMINDSCRTNDSSASPCIY